MKIDWKRKLSSRKFWAAAAGFIAPLLLAFGLSEAVVTQVTGLIMSCGSLIAFIIAEGFIDAKSNKE